MILFKATPGDYKEKNLTVDHIDKDEYNFSLSNLRWADKSKQSENQNKQDANRIYYSIQDKKAFGVEDLSESEKIELLMLLVMDIKQKLMLYLMHAIGKSLIEVCSIYMELNT